MSSFSSTCAWRVGAESGSSAQHDEAPSASGGAVVSGARTGRRVGERRQTRARRPARSPRWRAAFVFFVFNPFLRAGDLVPTNPF